MRAKKALIAALLALATTLAVDTSANAAPSDTPARACTRVIDLKALPAGTNLDLVNQAARSLGLAEVPTVLSGACNTSIRTDAYHETTPYPGRGPVVLREDEYAPRQQYCTDSVSVVGDTSIPGTDLPPMHGLIVFASGCTDEPNPLLV
ncbi:hypothetical protein [Streptomyces sp. NPDC006971]|uniref:hypothetical protein n=1 Tax=Streptomyces sp. NPDC006971 TaxID=3154784 RepID=UPI0033CD75FD